MNITHQTVIGEDGRPEAAIIPWSVFEELQAIVGDKEPNEATRDAMAEPTENLPRFASVEALKADLET